jgi:polysaccharide export outer membrane protein
MKHTIIAPTVAALVAATFCTLAPLAAAGPKDADQKADTQVAGVSDEDYRLGPGDKLRIEVYKDVQLSQSVQVRPDGKITLPLVGDVTAASCTPIELRDAITTSLKEYITNPTVTVIVVEATAATAYVMGEVNHPGAVSLQAPLTVMQALALAGGLKDFADAKNIRILRPGRAGAAVQTIAFNYKAAIKSTGTPIYLRRGDTVVVPD